MCWTIASLIVALFNSQLARWKGRSGIEWFFVSLPLFLLVSALILVWPRPKRNYFEAIRSAWSRTPKPAVETAAAEPSAAEPAARRSTSA